jgi:Galactosyltransferase
MLFISSINNRARCIGIACSLPWILILILYRSFTPYTNTEYRSKVSVGQIIYPKIYNPVCAKFNGNVDSANYFNYTSGHLDCPVTANPSISTNFLNAKYHFAVNTAPKNFLARSVIRQTWMKTLEENAASGRGNCSGTVKFYVGQTSDQEVAEKLHQEMLENSDMVFIEFCDSYEFLSLKTFNIMKSVMVLQGPLLEWIVKIDDDMLPNFPAFFDCFPAVIREDYGIFGWVTVGESVTHDVNSKYWVSSQAWNQSKYPPFAHGPSYAVRASVLPELVSTSRKTPLLNLEDVWLTGIVAEAAKVKILNVPGFILLDYREEDFLKYRHGADLKGFFYHSAAPKMIERLWKNADVVPKCCDCYRQCAYFLPDILSESL